MGIKKDLRVRLEEQADIVEYLTMIVEFDRTIHNKKDYPCGFNFVNKRLIEWAILKTCILFDEDSFSGFKKIINSLTKGGESTLDRKYKDMKSNFEALNLKELRNKHIAHLDSNRDNQNFNHSDFYLLIEDIKSFHNQLRTAFIEKFELDSEVFIFGANSKFLVELLP